MVLAARIETHARQVMEIQGSMRAPGIKRTADKVITNVDIATMKTELLFFILTDLRRPGDRPLLKRERHR